jgi:hypothetical protein
MQQDIKLLTLFKGNSFSSIVGGRGFEPSPYKKLNGIVGKTVKRK